MHDFGTDEIEEMADLAAGLSLSEPTREDLYTMGYNFYNHGKYDEAASCFATLALSDSSNAKHWMGLGAAQQMNKKFEEALGAYSFAALTDVLSPRPSMHAAECFFALKRIPEGLAALEAAEILAQAKEEDHCLLSRLAAMRETNINHVDKE